jgi:hypothetical protein
MKIKYEWKLETLDENGDVADVRHLPALSEANYDAAISLRERLVLARDILDGEGWLEDREHAYPAIRFVGRELRGDMPTEFDGGSRVPVRFQRALERWAAGC